MGRNDLVVSRCLYEGGNDQADSGPGDSNGNDSDEDGHGSIERGIVQDNLHDKVNLTFAKGVPRANICLAALNLYSLEYTLRIAGTNKSTLSNVTKVDDLEDALAAAFEASAKEKKAKNVTKVHELNRKRFRVIVDEAQHLKNPESATNLANEAVTERGGDNSEAAAETDRRSARPEAEGPGARPEEWRPAIYPT
ncbi:hypothetical protein V500_06058 [Pseudogymnoascus sp. VKM F-4518 (FW-2643)]|nr:hypothetical protein V500_06058 [Pseudogymnoascus sp. VKM F-4518 (FW-2643)]